MKRGRSGPSGPTGPAGPLASRLGGLVALIAVSTLIISAQALPTTLDKAGEKWVETTFKAMTLDDKVGQLIVTSADSTYLASDTDEFERLAKRVTDLHVGGIHLFGGTERTPGVLLDPNYGATILGDAFAAASLLNRLQTLSKIPLLNTSDFEAGVGFRIQGATSFPRAMAFGAAGDESLAFDAAKITAIEARALGVQVDFSPIADVNNNPRNPVINTRSFGEVPDAVGRLTAAYVRGMHAGGMLATLKHFPGHGDTDVDSHLGLPIIQKPRASIDAVELPSFKSGMAAGADAVMMAHIELPALDADPFSPASLSRPIVTGILRDELKFDGLVYTDSLSMEAITKALSPGDAAVRAIKAGNDIVLQSPDDVAAFAGIKSAVERGEIPMAQLDASVTRILRAKARVGLDKQKVVPLDQIASLIGGRAHMLVAADVSQRSITLVKDERNQVPFAMPRESTVLYVSALDYPAGWRIAAPSRTFIPELRKRWPNVTAVEVSDRTTPAELDLVRTMASHFDAVIVSVFVRANSGSGRMDLAPPVTKLIGDLARAANASKRPMIATCFGNPYVATGLPDVPAMLLTYDLGDLAEASAVHAIAGDARITGNLPITLPGLGVPGGGLAR